MENLKRKQEKGLEEINKLLKENDIMKEEDCAMTVPTEFLFNTTTKIYEIKADFIYSEIFKQIIDTINKHQLTIYLDNNKLCIY